MDGWMDGWFFLVFTCSYVFVSPENLSYDDARAFLSRSMKVSHEFWPLHRCGEVVVAPARNA
jgi:hypothetical protein